MKALKAFLLGFLFGIGITWLLFFILTPIIGGSYDMMFSHSDDIFSYSLAAGSFSSLIWLLVYGVSQRTREKREMEKTMTEYFQKKMEQEFSEEHKNNDSEENP